MRPMIPALALVLMLAAAGCKSEAPSPSPSAAPAPVASAPAAKPAPTAQPVTATSGSNPAASNPATTASTSDFAARWATWQKTPAGVGEAFVAAGLIYAKDEAAGLKALTQVIGPRQLRNGELSGPDQRRFRERWGGGRAHIPRSYVVGTSPANGYAVPAGPVKVDLRVEAPRAPGAPTKVFIRSSGADSPRPLWVEQQPDGSYRATNWSSLQVGIRPPA